MNGHDQEGIKGKILLVLVLYIVLGLIVFFNCGHYRHIFESMIEGKKDVYTNYQESSERNE